MRQFTLGVLVAMLCVAFYVGYVEPPEPTMSVAIEECVNGTD